VSPGSTWSRFEQQRGGAEREHQCQVRRDEQGCLQQRAGVGPRPEGGAEPHERDDHRDAVEDRERVRPLEHVHDDADGEQRERHLPGALHAPGELRCHEHERQAHEDRCHMARDAAGVREQRLADAQPIVERGQERQQVDDAAEGRQPAQEAHRARGVRELPPANVNRV
jgi:hypothetical protein